MFFLVVLGLIGAVACEPQTIIPFSYGMMTHHMTPFIHHDPIATYPMTTSGIYPYSPKVIIPAHEIARSSSIIPKPVEDTPEVKLAKANFAVQYQKALIGIHDTTSIVRAKRDLTHVMPMQYNTMPYMNNYMMPYVNHMTPITTNTHMYTSPIVSHY